MKKIFREHRGGLKESLATTIECPNGLSDIALYFEKNSTLSQYWFADNISIGEPMRDDRLPEEWGNRQYIVTARGKDGNKFVLGFCNFR